MNDYWFLGQLLDSVGVSGDDGEKEEELSVEELSEDETGHHYQLGKQRLSLRWNCIVYICHCHV